MKKIIISFIILGLLATAGYFWLPQRMLGGDANIDTSKTWNINQSTTTTIKSVPTNGLVAYWTMDDNDVNGTTIYDKGGQEYDATMVNTPTTGQVGIRNESIFFDTANNEYANVGDSLVTNLRSTNEFTATFWINLDSFANNGGVLGFGTTGERPLWIYTIASTEVLRVQSNTNSSAGLAELSSLSLDTWYLIVCGGRTADNSFFIYAYDETGNLVESSQDITYSGDINPVTSGSNHIALLEGFNEMDGNLDEIRLYNRKLSDTEISALLNSYMTNL